mgnify:CR=1 FL=1
MTNDDFHIHHGDCIPHMFNDMEPQSMDLAVFSPPFNSVYAYSSSDSDIGNSENLRGDGKVHLSFFYRALARVVKPGRVIVVQVQQIPRTKRSGEVGLHDFRGMNIRIGERAGLIYEYDWLVSKNPQSQAIRTKSRELQFAGLEDDRARSRGALCDYLIKFRVPGENAVPVNSKGEVSRNDWIQWAEGFWSDIKETDTLNTKEAKSETDVKHICPLQLGVIRRIIKLYSNPGETVFSPFAGIGSEGYVAIGLDRKFYGIELKPEYHEVAIRNCSKAVKIERQQSLLFAEEAA